MGHDSDDVDIDIEAAEYPVQELFQAFAFPPARYTVGVLADARSASLDELAESVTEVHREHFPSEEEKGDSEQMKIALYHIILPLLDDVGIIEFDADELKAELNQDAEATTAFLTLLRTFNHSDSVME